MYLFLKKLITDYIILALLWIFYCVLHSVPAAAKWKSFLERNTGKLFRYYRISYSIFFTITLFGILYFQYSFKSTQLFQSLVLKYISLLLLLLPGLLIMGISIFKYFKLLSGIRSLYQAKPSAHLKLEGIHKYVRHPLYLGTILFIWGLFFIFPMLNNLIAIIIITLYTLIGIQFEEKKLIKEFGNEYTEYIKKVPAIIPRFSNL